MAASVEMFAGGSSGYAGSVRLLVLGGGIFVGEGIVREAVSRGHVVTTFTRGRHLDRVSPGVEVLTGDRRSTLASFTGREWDVVIDTSGYRPMDVRRACHALRDKTSLYVFVSTLDVYPDHSVSGLDESAQIEASWDTRLLPSTKDGYRLLKAACEHEVRDAFPSDHLIFRSGLIVGPRDPRGNLNYWADRFARGGEILAPAPSDTQLQFIDARDHASFIIDRIEAGVAPETFNTTSPPGDRNFRDLVTACARLASSAISVTWVDAQLLHEYAVRPWVQLPLWIGDDERRSSSMLVATDRAAAAGLRCRSVAETVRDIDAWSRSLTIPISYPHHLAPLRERQLLLIAHDEGFVVEIGVRD